MESKSENGKKMSKEKSKNKIENLVLLGYPGLSGSRFLWEKGENLPFSKRYREEEKKRIEELFRLSWKENTLSFSAENIYLFTDEGRKGQPIPLYEEDIQAKENAGEIERGRLEDLFPRFAEEFSLSEVLPLGKGGILSGLWEMGGGGFSFSYSKIFFLQSTIEICEHFQLSPYALHSKGAFLLRLERGEDFACLAREKGIEASCIGRYHEEKKRIRKDEYGESFLTRQETDSLEEIFKKEEIAML